jgi:hypothetical protein
VARFHYLPRPVKLAPYGSIIIYIYADFASVVSRIVGKGFPASA